VSVLSEIIIRFL